MLPSVSRTSATGTDWINCMKPTGKYMHCLQQSYWVSNKNRGSAKNNLHLQMYTLHT